MKKTLESGGTGKGKWSPNQHAKREHIIEATRQLMAGKGPHACTARSIANASAVSNSALHYYFEDVWEIRDIAFRRIFDDFVESISRAVAGETKPIEKIWAGATAFLEYNSQELPSLNDADQAPTRYANLLWLEYQMEAARYGDLSTVIEYANLTGSIFPPLFAAAGIDDAEIRADVFYLALIGATERELLLHKSVRSVLSDLGRALGLPLSRKYCQSPRKTATS